jgi:hypothetical protein
VTSTALRSPHHAGIDSPSACTSFAFSPLKGEVCSNGSRVQAPSILTQCEFQSQESRYFLPSAPVRQSSHRKAPRILEYFLLIPFTSDVLLSSLLPHETTRSTSWKARPHSVEFVAEIGISMQHLVPKLLSMLPLMQLDIPLVLHDSGQTVITGPELLLLKSWLGVLKSMHRGWLWVRDIHGGTIYPLHRLLFDAS